MQGLNIYIRELALQPVPLNIYMQLVCTFIIAWLHNLEITASAALIHRSWAWNTCVFAGYSLELVHILYIGIVKAL
jgi:hypothetical protein